MRIFRAVTGVVAAFLLYWATCPFFIGILNAGVIASVIVLSAVILLCIFYHRVAAVVRRLWAQMAGRILLSAAAVLSAAMLVLFVTASALMLHSTTKTPPPGGTVIVLGAGLNGGWPSLMLAQRLDAAAQYLLDNPDSSCVLSGGQGPDEICTEANAMFRYITTVWKIDPARLYLEELSVNTQQNIAFSMDIIRRESLSENVVIATQEFHQYRAGQMALRSGAAEVGPAVCHTPIYLLECYWVREFAAVGYFWILGQ